MDATDEKFLRRTFEIAAASREHGNGPHGSLLVGADGTILVEEENSRATDRDITAHPELKVARWAARELDAEAASAATLYTNCYPCQMCAQVIQRAGIGRVVFALASEQTRALKATVASSPVEVVYEGPTLYDEARVAVEGYSEPPRVEYYGIPR